MALHTPSTVKDAAAGAVTFEWLPASTAPVRQRVRVSHELDPSSQKERTICPVYGVFDGDSWDCEAGFVCTDGMFRFDPTHWAAA